MDMKTAKSMHVDTVILESNHFLPPHMHRIFFPILEMLIDYYQTKGISKQIPGFRCVTP